MEQKESSGFPLAFLLGAGVVALMLGGVWLLTRESASNAPPREQRLPMGAVERTYAGHIHFQDVKLARAANFLNQEVTFIFGVLANDGARRIRELEVTIEFRDLLNQIVLRETRRLVGKRVAPLPAGQRREFQITLEHVPEDWNRQYPTLRVTGIVLE